jgi:hypothetical protein
MITHPDLTYHDMVAALPLHLKDQWFTHRRERMRDNHLWSLLDQATDILCTSNPELSTKLEEEMDRITEEHSEELFHDFMLMHEKDEG